MTLRKKHEEEEKHWEDFAGLIQPLSIEPEFYHLNYDIGPDSKPNDPIYTARMNFLGDIEGIGSTPEKAKEDLIKKFRNMKDPKNA